MATIQQKCSEIAPPPLWACRLKYFLTPYMQRLWRPSNKNAANKPTPLQTLPVGLLQKVSPHDGCSGSFIHPWPHPWPQPWRPCRERKNGFAKRFIQRFREKMRKIGKKINWNHRLKHIPVRDVPNGFEYVNKNVWFISCIETYSCKGCTQRFWIC